MFHCGSRAITKPVQHVHLLIFDTLAAVIHLHIATFIIRLHYHRATSSLASIFNTSIINKVMYSVLTIDMDAITADSKSRFRIR